MEKRPSCKAGSRPDVPAIASLLWSLMVYLAQNKMWAYYIRRILVIDTGDLYCSFYIPYRETGSKGFLDSNVSESGAFLSSGEVVGDSYSIRSIRNN